MTRGGRPALTGLDVADGPEVWRGMGFAVGAGGACVIGGVALHLHGAGEGLPGWSLDADHGLPAEVDGIPTRLAPAPAECGEHPNGATGLDHVVIRTPDLQRTLAALGAVGLEVRRIRDAGAGLQQAFLWAGDVLLEVAGPAAPAGDEPASLWGLVVVVPDLAPLAALPGAPVGSVRPAVQEGRLIATVRREAGSSVPLAFMTPHRRRANEEGP